MFFALIVFLVLRFQAPPSYENQWVEVRRTISRSYYARQTRATEMNRLLDLYGPKIGGSKSQEEFESNVNAMIAAFGDSHFTYLTRSDQGWYLMDSLEKGPNAEAMPNIGAWFRMTPAGYEVQMLLDGLPAMLAGIRKGDIVEECDGQPFSPVDSLTGHVNDQVQLTILRDNRRLTKAVKVSSQKALAMFFDASVNSVKIIDDHGRHIGYFHLWTMAGDEFKNALSSAIYGKLKNTDGFILDIRDGFGGRPEGYADPFFRPDVEITWVMGGSRLNQLFGYGRPLVTIINNGSRSAKEILSYVLKKSHRATLVGSTTAGNVLGTTPMKLGSGAYLEIPIADVYADGTHLEGKGVAPDVTVPKEFDNDGKDLDLDVALDRLKDVPEHRKFAQA
jgi:carboxyl-terminal processing protease